MLIFDSTNSVLQIIPQEVVYISQTSLGAHPTGYAQEQTKGDSGRVGVPPAQADLPPNSSSCPKHNKRKWQCQQPPAREKQKIFTML